MTGTCICRVSSEGTTYTRSILHVNWRFLCVGSALIFHFGMKRQGTQVLYGQMNQCFEQRAARMSSLPPFHHEHRTYEHAATQGKRPFGVVVHSTRSTALSRLIYMNVYTALGLSSFYRKASIVEEATNHCPEHMCQNSLLSSVLRGPR